MADLYLKSLESERKALWAECRLKGLARDTPKRLRIAAIDEAIAAHKAKQRPAKQAQPDQAKSSKRRKGKPRPKSTAAKAPEAQNPPEA